MNDKQSIQITRLDAQKFSEQPKFVEAEVLPAVRHLPKIPRKRGARDIKTVMAKEAIEAVFENMGGIAAMTKWARANPGDFYRILFPRLIPLQVDHGGSAEIILRWLPPGSPEAE